MPFYDAYELDLLERARDTLAGKSRSYVEDAKVFAEIILYQFVPMREADRSLRADPRKDRASPEASNFAAP